jgi:alkyl hydroperoxide reductase subunit AhpF
VKINSSFAAGAMTSSYDKQVLIAVGEGTEAVLNAYELLAC